jgi:hypothetical protein
MHISTQAAASLRRYGRRRARGIERLVRLGRPLKALKSHPSNVAITPSELEELRRAWVNPGYEADLDYLQLVCDHALSANGAVLECGTGVTTVLLALTAGRRNLPVWSLEHDVCWYRAMRRILTRFELGGINLCFAPLVPRNGFAWYDAPLTLMPVRFELVVCDGPPGSSPGGRSGLLPVMGRRLHGATILVDDAERPSERAMMAGWTELGASPPQILTTRTGSQVATISVPQPRCNG